MSILDDGDEKKRISEEAKKIFPCDLPIGVYLVTKQGKFIRCNRKAREILDLQETGGGPNEVNGNINDFYCDPDERLRLIKELEEAEAEEKFLEKKVIQFKVRGQKIWVQDYCRSIKDKKGEIIGYTGCLVDVNEEESLRQLFDKLPVGVYKLDAQNKIVRVNKALVDLLGCEHPKELEGLQIKTLYADSREADRFDKLIREKGFVVNERVELLKKSKERCFISVCAYKKTDTDSETYIGREGTIQDVTEDENYRQILDKLPVGTYIVKENENGKEVISQCNKAFANMFEYEIDDVKGKEVKEFYATRKDYDDFVKEIKEKHQQHEITEGIPIKAKKSNGRSMSLDVHCRLLTDRDGNILGRAGVVFDTSNEVALRELRNDIGKILHFYSATLVTLEHSIKPILKALSPDPFDSSELLTTEKSLAALNEPSRNLEKALSRFIEMGKKSPERRCTIKDTDWLLLENQLRLLEEYNTWIPYPEFRITALHEVSGNILDIYNKIEKRKLPREFMRDLFHKAKELERVCCLIRTHQTLDTLVEVDYSIKSLREYVIFQQRHSEPYKVCKISTLIQDVVYQLYLFAKHRKVTIKQEYQSCQARVNVDERSVLRALSNLLYNAIKYSWHRGIGQPPWITVKAFTVQDKVHVEFQNYGVPIAKEEIENESIFRFGYRGKYSGDRRRIGTGIGLSDARETASKHGGDVVIKSLPASGENELELDYNQPFLTTATLILPLCK
jgi:PAS domain S-box-containing protein